MTDKTARALEELTTLEGTTFSDPLHADFRYAKFVIDHRQTIRECLEAQTWRPISEAPHETDVLLYIPATEHTPFKMEAGWAHGGQITFSQYGSVSSRWTHGSATKWRPLPPPPETGDKE